MAHSARSSSQTRRISSRPEDSAATLCDLWTCPQLQRRNVTQRNNPSRAWRSQRATELVLGVASDRHECFVVVALEVVTRFRGDSDTLLNVTVPAIRSPDRSTRQTAYALRAEDDVVVIDAHEEDSRSRLLGWALASASIGLASFPNGSCTQCTGPDGSYVVDVQAASGPIPSDLMLEFRSS